MKLKTERRHPDGNEREARKRSPRTLKFKAESKIGKLVSNASAFAAVKMTAFQYYANSSSEKRTSEI